MSRLQMLAAVSSCLLLLWLTARVVEAQESGKRVAVLVGINTYQKPFFRNLKFAERDVEQSEAELQRLGFEVTRLAGEHATREAIADALQTAVAPLSKEDVALVMLCGHGQQIDVTDAEGRRRNDAFFCPYDAIQGKPETLLSLSYVIDEVLAPNVGRKLLLVDACRDDPTPGRGARGIEGKTIALPEDTAVLFSCRKGQQSYESDELQHGLFTHCVLEALRGEGARDEAVDWSNLVAHVNYRMASQVFRKHLPEGRAQEPIPAGGVPYTVLGRIATTPGTPKPGDVITNTIGMKLVLIPAGEFLMGSPTTETGRFDSQGPQHRVQITTPFLLGQYEVAQGEWQAVMGTNPSCFSTAGFGKNEVTGLDTSRFPVEQVSWYDAVEFCNKLSARDKLSPYYALSNVERAEGSMGISSATVSINGGKGYRLPTEAEWEYACRAGTTTPFHFGTTSNGREANVDGNSPYGSETKGPSLARTTTVGSYPPNAFGLYDLHGNVWEWCADWYDATAYQGRTGVTRDPFVSSAGENRRVLRGGSWKFGARNALAASRPGFTPGAQGNYNGFRLARTP